jgi:1-acyl-sn-glycerol-3-phosphate acyltransferase
VGSAVRTVDPRAYVVARRLLGLMFGWYLKTHVSGAQRIPLPGVPTLITANHSSSLDVFAAGYALGRPGHFLAKVEATRMPLFGRFLLAVGAIPTHRDGGDTEVLRQMLAILGSGGLVGVAPEGTRSPDGTLRAYDPGFAWVAARTGAVIVPCAIHGAYRLMPKGARMPRRGELWVRFGEPVPPADWLPDGTQRPSREELQAVADEVRRRTLVLLTELVAESGLANPAVDQAA